jgi:myo-inositol 2-dehydrogenase / D-chiro-inositol 1-dehydrogenase
MTRRLGIGFLGAGQATQAIHLPALANLGEDFCVEQVFDTDAGAAAPVAARCGARVANSTAVLLADPAVEVVAICSPHAFHAEQAIAACRAGKKLVLCEKPLAATRVEARDIADVAFETGTHIVVGAMHVYDPAYRAAHAAWVASGDDAQHVHSTIFLPSNDRFIDQATDRAPQANAGARPRPDFDDPVVHAAILRAAILGLAIHDLPLIRAFAPEIGEVESARFLPGFGYEMSFRSDACSVRLLAMMPGRWEPCWTLRAIGRNSELFADFPPSYVLAGSCRAEHRKPDGVTAFQFDRSGYEAMWSHARDLVVGASATTVELDDVIADFDYAMDLADRVDAFLGVRT